MMDVAEHWATAGVSWVSRPGHTEECRKTIQHKSEGAHRGHEGGQHSGENFRRHSTDLFDVRETARHLGAARSVVTSFAGGSLKVCRIFIFFASCLECFAVKRTRPRIPADGHTFSHAIIVDTRRSARAHVAFSGW